MGYLIFLVTRAAYVSDNIKQKFLKPYYNISCCLLYE